MQTTLRPLYQQGKIDKPTYQKTYPSVALTPTANPAIKAHKPSKQYPVRLITSHIGAPQEGLASFLNEILKPFIECSKFVTKNSQEFVEKIKKAKIGAFEKMVSYDATALFPSVPITEAIKVIRDLLIKDVNLKSRTNLNPDEICELISLCLSSSDFIFNGRHHTQNDSGPIGLSLMVCVSQIWMVYTMEQALKTAKNLSKTIPRLISIYMDDIWCIIPYRREGLRSSANDNSDPAVDFNECLNSVHERVQFTREDEDNGSIAFLDVLVKREDDGKFSTSVYRKPSNTNLTIKPQSCQHPNTVTATFKSEICRAYRLCSTDEQVKKEIDFVTNMFEDNGHNRKNLDKIAKDYTPPSLGQKSQNSKNKKSRKPNKNTNEDIPDNLFDILPFRDTNISEDEYKPYIVTTYLPDGIHHQLKRACDKAGVSLVSKPGVKLKDILCGPNRTRHDKLDKPGVYELTCPCDPKAKYVGQTIRPISTRISEHKKAAEKGNFQHSGIVQHRESCTVPMDWEPRVITNMLDKSKRKMTYNLKVREALEIKRQNTGPNNGLNEDWGAYVKTNAWNPVFNQM